MIDIRPAASRFHTDLGWLDSWHSFSFGGHHDPANTHHGLLLVSNDDIVAPSAGFPTHPHRDMEIVTWVLAGELEHADTIGSHGVISPGQAQRMSAGTGVRHSEQNPSASVPVRLVQMWVVPDTKGREPSYEQVDIDDELRGDTLVPLASGQPDLAAVTIGQRDATLWVGRLDPGVTVKVPPAPHVHAFVAVGSARLGEDHLLATGDAARLTDEADLSLSVGADGAEVLIWATA